MQRGFLSNKYKFMETLKIESEPLSETYKEGFERKKRIKESIQMIPVIFAFFIGEVLLMSIGGEESVRFRNILKQQREEIKCVLEHDTVEKCKIDLEAIYMDINNTLHMMDVRDKDADDRLRAQIIMNAICH